MIKIAYFPKRIVDDLEWSVQTYQFNNYAERIVSKMTLACFADLISKIDMLSILSENLMKILSSLLLIAFSYEIRSKSFKTAIVFRLHKPVQELVYSINILKSCSTQILPAGHSEISQFKVIW